MDIINASLLYFAATNEKKMVSLGSCRPAPQDKLENHSAFADSGTWVSQDTVIHYGGKHGRPRYAEPRISSLIGESIAFLSRKYQGENDVLRLRRAIEVGRYIHQYTDLFFVDGGGDSLILTPQDAAGTSESTDPFHGGDAKVLEALSGLARTYLGVISVGLDVSEERFQKNVQLLNEKEAYLGRVNLATGVKQDYRLDEVIGFEERFLEDYYHLAEEILVLEQADVEDSSKTKSHTAVVTYHALKGNFGRQRTYVRWEPKFAGEKGVVVRPEHRWMYFFDAGAIHQLKMELSR